MVPGRPPGEAVTEAIRFANSSPCQKSKRGAVLFGPLGVVIAGDHNGLPLDEKCDGDEFCRSTCGKRCMHAEERLLLKVGGRTDLWLCEMLHVKTVSGELVPSGSPSCWQCSRSMVDVRLGWMWLYHETGWTRYNVPEFHGITMRTCNLARK